jgi:secreted trypsin-like serine protease
MIKTLAVTLFAVSLAACSGQADDQRQDQNPQDDTATADQEIINGATDTGDPCVVAVFARVPGASSGSLCTGTIVGPHTVLTAAHCVDPRVIGAGQEVDIITGPALNGSLFVASSTTFNPIWDLNNLQACHDEGIVHTAATLSPTCPLAGVNTAAAVRIVGYGTNTHAGAGAGTKRQATVSIVGANAVLFQDGNSNSQTCHGDSGGPAFQGAAVVGVTSFGQDASPTNTCLNGGFHCRVDADLGFIQANIN